MKMKGTKPSLVARSQERRVANIDNFNCPSYQSEHRLGYSPFPKKDQSEKVKLFFCTEKVSHLTI
jgi:hypothetical protein